MSEPLPAWIRVEDKDTGHQFDISGVTYDANPDVFTKVNAPKAYPDLFGDGARPRATKYRTDKSGQPPATTTKKES